MSKVGKNKGGRPSIYTPELAAEIFTRLCEPRSLRSVCDDPDMPTRSTVLYWVVNDEQGKPWHGFSAQYAQARQVQAHVWAEEISDIADNDSSDWRVDKAGNLIVEREQVARSRLRVDTRKWLLSKVLPKVYGDKVALTGPGGGPIEFKDATDAELIDAARQHANRIAAMATHRNGTSDNGAGD